GRRGSRRRSAAPGRGGRRRRPATRGRGRAGRWRPRWGRVRGGSLFAFVLGVLVAAGQAALDRLEEALHGERLADVVDDAEVLRVGLVAAALVGGDHDDRRGVGLAAEVLQDGVAAHARHHHVEDDQVGPVLVYQLLALL